MKKIIVIATLLGLPFGLNAQENKTEGKEVTLEGTGLCAKCELGEAEACTNALQVEDAAGKVTTYYFTSNMKHGAYFCDGTTENLVVTGSVVEKDGKPMLTPASVEKKES